MLADQLREMPLDRIASALQQTNHRIEGIKARAKADLAAYEMERELIQDELRARYGALIEHQASMKDEPCGKIDVPVNRFKLTADIKRKVKWNSKQVYAVAQQCLEDEFRRLFGASLSILERGYKDTHDVDLKALMDEGRTVTYEAPVITLTSIDGADEEDY